ncbi:MAG: hypothetical protein M3P50_05805 [Actinomycetota bacterium]|nr:hypothetical protein [Actinomycetota bacterium]
MHLLRALACAALLGLALPAGASAAELYAPSEGALPARPFAAPLRDAVISEPAASARASRAPVARASAQRIYASNGQGPVTVELSPNYGPLTRERVLPFVDFLASRQHGTELSRLTLFVVTPEQVRQACSAQALACYIPSRGLMIIPGQQTSEGEVPVEYVITHEYGHHVAANRNNDPWPAVAWGPKAWATQEGVCAGVAQRRYFPGDQQENYARNPGENWAEAYAQAHYPGQYRWQFDPTLAPDGPAIAAVARDVAEPWRNNVAVRRSGTLSGRRRSKTFPVTTTLDGRLKLTLKGPRRANYDLQVISDGRVAVRSRRRGSRDTLSATDCQVRSFAVRVVRRSGSGRFTLRVQTPG